MTRAAGTVSVIVTAYNYADYLPAAIDSALAQDHPAEALEVVVVDDGSTDATPEVMAAYGDRIVAVRRPNGGLMAATQTGMEHATGDYLTFLDADDTWRPGRVRALAAALDADPAAGLAWGDMEVVRPDGSVLHPSFRAVSQIPPLSGRVFGRLVRGNFISAGSMMVRGSLRHLYAQVPAIAPYQDWWIASQVARVADVVAIPTPVNRYLHHGANMNLGTDEAKRVAILGTEIPFRRHLLQTAGELATPQELLEGLRQLDIGAQFVGASRGVPAHAVYELTEADRDAAIAAVHDASAALDEGRLELALSHLIRAVAHDPMYPDARELAGQLAPHVVAAAAPVAA